VLALGLMGNASATRRNAGKYGVRLKKLITVQEVARVASCCVTHRPLIGQSQSLLRGARWLIKPALQPLSFVEEQGKLVTLAHSGSQLSASQDTHPPAFVYESSLVLHLKTHYPCHQLPVQTSSRELVPCNLGHDGAHSPVAGHAVNGASSPTRTALPALDAFP
jgi:hypothetical protein